MAHAAPSVAIARTAPARRATLPGSFASPDVTRLGTDISVAASLSEVAAVPGRASAAGTRAARVSREHVRASPPRRAVLGSVGDGAAPRAHDVGNALVQRFLAAAQRASPLRADRADAAAGAPVELEHRLGDRGQHP